VGGRADREGHDQRNGQFNVKGAKVIVLGLTFKENCPDLRNSKVIDVILVKELQILRLRCAACTTPSLSPPRLSTSTA
jgi:UDP-N-acetyl-D-mannosaminuronate dehydrogenase